MLSQWLLKLICVVECVYESAHTHTQSVMLWLCTLDVTMTTK